MSKVYETTILNTGGREGEVISPDKSFLLKVTSPGSKVKDATNPEQLFAAAYSSCFNGALELVMSKHKIKQPSFVTARVALFNEADTGFHIEVTLDVKIDGLDKEAATELIKEADQVCPYSKALRGNVAVTLNVI